MSVAPPCIGLAGVGSRGLRAKPCLKLRLTAAESGFLVERRCQDDVATAVRAILSSREVNSTPRVSSGMRFISELQSRVGEYFPKMSREAAVDEDLERVFALRVHQHSDVRHGALRTASGRKVRSRQIEWQVLGENTARPGSRDREDATPRTQLDHCGGIGRQPLSKLRDQVSSALGRLHDQPAVGTEPEDVCLFAARPSGRLLTRSDGEY